MPPQVRILHLVEGAKKARGLTVIIDVCRAFTVAAYAFDGGAKSIIPVAAEDEAFKIRECCPSVLLMGEVKGKKIAGFDLGNSPSEIVCADLRGKVIAQKTSAGTVGIVNANAADEILSGGFVNAGAIVRYILDKDPKEVSLVCMGVAAIRPCVEDTLCAEYLRDSIYAEKTNFPLIRQKMLESETGAKFKNPEKPWFPEADLDLCTDLDRFSFVLRCFRNPSSQLEFERIDV